MAVDTTLHGWFRAQLFPSTAAERWIEFQPNRVNYHLDVATQSEDNWLSLIYNFFQLAFNIIDSCSFSERLKDKRSTSDSIMCADTQDNMAYVVSTSLCGQLYGLYYTCKRLIKKIVLNFAFWVIVGAEYKVLRKRTCRRRGWIIMFEINIEADLFMFHELLLRAGKMDFGRNSFNW